MNASQMNREFEAMVTIFSAYSTYAQWATSGDNIGHTVTVLRGFFTDELVQRGYAQPVGTGYELTEKGREWFYAHKNISDMDKADARQLDMIILSNRAAAEREAAPKSVEEISASAAANTAKAADEAYASGEPVEIEARREPNEIYSAASLDYLPDGLYVYASTSGKKTMFVVVSGSVHGRRFEVRANVAGNLYTAYYMAADWNVYSSQPVTVRRWGTPAQYDALLAQIVASSDAMHDMMLNS